jgi:hypothetical protein
VFFVTRSPECVPPGADISAPGFERAHDFVPAGAAGEVAAVIKAGFPAFSAGFDIVERGREF